MVLMTVAQAEMGLPAVVAESAPRQPRVAGEHGGGIRARSLDRSRRCACCW